MTAPKAILDDVLEAAETSEEISDALCRIAEAAEKLLSVGLTERAIVVLIRDKTSLPLSDIRAVLHALTSLTDYVRSDD